MRVRIVGICLLLWSVAFAEWLAADEFPLPTVVLRKVPANDEEVAKAHAGSEYACLEIPAGYPLAQPQLDQRIGYRGTDEAQVFWCDSARRTVATLGMEMTPDDQRELPLLTGQAILDRVQRQYMALQVRVQRESPSGELFLHYRPMAATCAYGNRDRTIGMASLMQTAVRDVRSLGLYVPEGEPITPQSLRTLVIVYRSNQDIREGEATARPAVVRYEFVLIRGREVASAEGQPDLQLHVFATSDGRQKFHYLAPHELPSVPPECDVLSTIYFTDYALGNLFPTARAARRVAVRAAATHTLESLNGFVSSHYPGESAWDRLDLVLDAIIDQRVTSHADRPAVVIAEDGTRPAPSRIGEPPKSAP